MIKRKNGKKKGFSLIELIIVLAVMAIIALIAIPNFTAVKENAKVKSDVQSCNAISRSIETLVVDESVKGTGKIAISLSGVTIESTITTDSNVFADSDALKKYIGELVDKYPQQKEKKGYIVTINSAGVTSVVATADELKAIK